MKTRFRIKRGWFGRSKVVLQVGSERSHFNMGIPYPLGTYWCWRDATEEDFLDRALGEAGPARSGADILRGRFETPDPCPGSKAQDHSTEIEKQ